MRASIVHAVVPEVRSRIHQKSGDFKTFIAFFMIGEALGRETSRSDIRISARIANPRYRLPEKLQARICDS